MQKLGIIASLILIGAALMGPISTSVAQESAQAGTNTTSSAAPSDADAKKNASTKPQKELTMEEKIKKELEERRAKLDAKLDERT
ncbi:MAG: hypothetical protein QXE82_02720, partial [Candidatus Nitrosotenuis sp.]